MSIRLSVSQKKWLLIVHLLFVIGWLGTAIVFLTVGFMAGRTTDANVLKAVYPILLTLDDTLMTIAAFGTLITGVLLCVLTQWGLFKFSWLIVKQVLTLFSIFLGWLYLHGLLGQVVDLVTAQGAGALHDPGYLSHVARLTAGNWVELLSMGTALVLSVLKPWGQRKRAPSKAA